jgi:hypothetical protein
LTAPDDLKLPQQAEAASAAYGIAAACSITRFDIVPAIRALNQWFDQLYPNQLFVRAKVYPSRTRSFTRVNVRISLDRTKDHVAAKGLPLNKHSYA